MSKVYAIVKSAYVGDSENPFICIDIVAILWHRTRYEYVCGYSLGHTAQFYADLESAKQHLLNVCDDAIVELDVNEQGQLTAFSALHRYLGRQEKFVAEAGTMFFNRVEVSHWGRREIEANEYTAGALAEIARQYAASGLANANAYASAPPHSALN